VAGLAIAGEAGGWRAGSPLHRRSAILGCVGATIPGSFQTLEAVCEPPEMVFAKSAMGRTRWPSYMRSASGVSISPRPPWRPSPGGGRPEYAEYGREAPDVLRLRAGKCSVFCVRRWLPASQLGGKFCPWHR